jgi:hypothetical protein
MKKPSHNVYRFSAKTAPRRRLTRFAIGFIIITALAAGCAVILIFNDSMPFEIFALFTMPGCAQGGLIHQPVLDAQPAPSPNGLDLTPRAGIGLILKRTDVLQHQ